MGHRYVCLRLTAHPGPAFLTLLSHPCAGVNYFLSSGTNDCSLSMALGLRLNLAGPGNFLFLVTRGERHFTLCMKSWLCYLWVPVVTDATGQSCLRDVSGRAILGDCASPCPAGLIPNACTMWQNTDSSRCVGLGLLCALESSSLRFLLKLFLRNTWQI